MRGFFFFQAEDGIRDWSVTGVQTCALPISHLQRQGTGPLVAVALEREQEGPSERREIAVELGGGPGAHVPPRADQLRDAGRQAVPGLGTDGHGSPCWYR